MIKLIKHLVHRGTHRGGTAIARALPQVRQVTLLDPNPAATDELGAFYRARGTRVTVANRRAEDVIDQIDAESFALAPDDLGPIEFSLRGKRASQHMEAQGVARASSSAGQELPIGVQWSAPPGRSDLQARSLELVRAFREVAPTRATSRAIRTSPMASLHLASVRRATSELTAARLADPMLAEDLEEASRLFLPTEAPMPLVLHRSQEVTRTSRVAEALALARGPAMAFALEHTGGIDVVAVATDRRGLRRVTVILPFARPEPPRAQPRALALASSLVLAAAFTD